MKVLALILALAFSASAQTLLSDDFSSSTPSPVWITGIGFSQGILNYYPAIVTSDQSGGQLVFTHPGSLGFWAGNAYMSQGVFNLSGRRASALLNATTGLQVWIAVGQDANHFARIEAVHGYDGLNYVQCDYSDSNKFRALVCVQPADYSAQSAYLSIRFQNNKVIFESSPDGLTWIERWRLNGGSFASAARVEVGGGMFQPFGGAITGAIDNVRVQ
jgi:hypothetical protein